MWGHGRTLSFQQEVGQRDQMSLCVQGCQVKLGQWSPRHKSPNGVTKEEQEAWLCLDEPQRAPVHIHIPAPTLGPRPTTPLNY
ncbi:hypothetical protein QQF64_009789 [Cirrhinus molitorella]|uniref:Uncharacterized protein n=1 Tax=Cirrhinus molitorella TaxID=172907 RepID=A0ABR3M5R2_9TELE